LTHTFFTVTNKICDGTFDTVFLESETAQIQFDRTNFPIRQTILFVI